MLDEKDLQAMAGLINQSIAESETRMKAYMDSNIGQSETRMKAYMESSVSQSENRMKTYIETNVEKKIQLLAEGHKRILERLPDADGQEQLKSRVKVLERVVTDLRTDVDELKKAQ